MPTSVQGAFLTYSLGKGAYHSLFGHWLALLTKANSTANPNAPSSNALRPLIDPRPGHGCLLSCRETWAKSPTGAIPRERAPINIDLRVGTMMVYCLNTSDGKRFEPLSLGLLLPQSCYHFLRCYGELLEPHPSSIMNGTNHRWRRADNATLGSFLSPKRTIGIVSDYVY